MTNQIQNPNDEKKDKSEDWAIKSAEDIHAFGRRTSEVVISKSK